MFDTTNAGTLRGQPNTFTQMSRILSSPITISDLQPFDKPLALKNLDSLTKFFFGLTNANVGKDVYVNKVFDILLSVISTNSSTEMRPSAETIHALDSLMQCLNRLLDVGDEARWQLVLNLIQQVLDRVPQRALMFKAKRSLLEASPDDVALLVGGLTTFQPITTTLLQLLVLVSAAPDLFDEQVTLLLEKMIGNIMDKTSTLEHTLSTIAVMETIQQERRVSIWIKIANHLKEHVLKTGQINVDDDQDGLDEVTGVLLFPLRHSFADLDHLSEAWTMLFNSVWKVMSDRKHTQRRLATLVHRLSQVPISNSAGLSRHIDAYHAIVSKPAPDGKKKSYPTILAWLDTLVTATVQHHQERYKKLQTCILLSFARCSAVCDSAIDWIRVLQLSLDVRDDQGFKDLATALFRDMDTFILLPQEKMARMEPILQWCFNVDAAFWKTWVSEELKPYQKDWPQWLHGAFEQEEVMETPKEPRRKPKARLSSGPLSSPSRRSERIVPKRASAEKVPQRERRHLVHEMESQEFVEITSKRREPSAPRDELQDRKRRRDDIPVMYNSLDHSSQASIKFNPNSPWLKELDTDVQLHLNPTSNDAPSREDTPSSHATSSNESFASDASIPNPVDFLRHVDLLLDARGELAKADQRQLFELYKKLSVLNSSIVMELEKFIL
jgi:hypothetical protein